VEPAVSLHLVLGREDGLTHATGELQHNRLGRAFQLLHNSLYTRLVKTSLYDVLVKTSL
jgi:hypothetical protein